jgi:hypothetical protein
MNQRYAYATQLMFINNIGKKAFQGVINLL